MKKLIITCAIVAAASGMSFAQSAQTAQSANPQPNAAAQNAPNKVQPEQMADRRSKMYQQQLGLTDQQTKDAYAIELDYAKQQLAMRSSATQPGQGQIMQMNMAKDQRYQNILTPDQFTKYSAGRPKSAAGPSAQPQSATAH